MRSPSQRVFQHRTKIVVYIGAVHRIALVELPGCPALHFGSMLKGVAADLAPPRILSLRRHLFAPRDNLAPAKTSDGGRARRLPEIGFVWMATRRMQPGDIV